MTDCHPIVEELTACVKNHEVSSIAFATSVLRGLRRTLEEITGAMRREMRTNLDGLPLDPKMVAGLKAVGTRWIYTNEGDTAKPFVRAWSVAQETKSVSEGS